jgi:hypothetical protein
LNQLFHLAHFDERLMSQRTALGIPKVSQINLAGVVVDVQFCGGNRFL